MVFPDQGVPGEQDVAYPVESFVSKGIGHLSGWEVIRVRWEDFDADSDNWIAASELRETMGAELFNELYEPIRESADQFPLNI